MKTFFAKKSLGQNFLIQPQIVKDIVVASGTTKNDLVVEVGPGTGLLTKELLATGARVIAIEKDHRLIETLSNLFAEAIAEERLTIRHEDILESTLDVKEPYRVVANIPYYITGKILRLFLEKTNKPQSMTVLVQKEVAERILARDKKESLLSISIKVYGKPEYVRTVKAGNFSPVPKVDSAVLHIANISNASFEHTSEEHFFDILRAGFSSKRKKLFKNLKSYNIDGKLEHAFDICGIEKGLRAEDLSLEQWVSLAGHLK